MAHTLHEFRNHTLVGSGAQGQVYVCEWQENPNRPWKRVALKVIFLLKGCLVEEEKKKLELALTLDHPNVVKHHRYKLVNGSQFHGSPHLLVVMEYCAGPTLEDALKSPLVNDSLRIKWLFQATEALAYLHDKKFMHRDIKPENILLDTADIQTASLKLVDFGFLKQLKNSVTGNDDQSAISRGTPSYMSPEMLHIEPYNVKVGRKTDVWSLGCIACRLFNPREELYPIARATNNSARILVIGTQLRSSRGPLRPPNTSITGGLQQFIDKCLQFDQKRRPTAEQLLKEPLFRSTSPGSDWTATRSEVKYVVQKNDTLSQIGERYGVRYAQIARDNGIPNPDFIRTGQKLIIKMPKR